MCVWIREAGIQQILSMELLSPCRWPSTAYSAQEKGPRLKTTNIDMSLTLAHGFRTRCCRLLLAGLLEFHQNEQNVVSTCDRDILNFTKDAFINKGSLICYLLSQRRKKKKAGGRHTLIHISIISSFSMLSSRHKGLPSFSSLSLSLSPPKEKYYFSCSQDYSCTTLWDAIIPWAKALSIILNEESSKFRLSLLKACNILVFSRDE